MHPISDRVFLGGALRAPRSDARITVLNPSTGEPLGRIPDGGAADVEDAVAAGGGGGRMGGDAGPRAWRHPRPARESPPRERGGVRATRQPGQRADACGNPGPGDAERRTARLLRGGGGQARGAGGAAREQRLRRDGARAVWRDRRADALERATSTDRAEDLARARGGERDGGEAIPARLLLHPPLRDSRFRSRTPGRSPECRDGRRGYRPRAGRRQPGRQGHLHGLDRDRTPDRKRLRSPRSIRRPRARGKCPLLVFADADLDHAAGETARPRSGRRGSPASRRPGSSSRRPATTSSRSGWPPPRPTSPAAIPSPRTRSWARSSPPTPDKESTTL